jgi:hypothetical protein
MRDFNERQKRFETQFTRDQELAFRIAARRNRLLGLWAAARLGIADTDAAEAYARTVVAADFAAPGDADVVAKVLADFDAKGIAVTEAEVRAALARAASEARAQLARA